MQAPAGTEQTVLVAPPRERRGQPRRRRRDDGRHRRRCPGCGPAPWPSWPRARRAGRGRGGPRSTRSGWTRPVSATWAPPWPPARTWPARSSGTRTPRSRPSTPRPPGRCRPPGARTPRGSGRPANGLVGAMDRLRGRVTLLAPADGTYTLASADAPLVLTVQNDLPFAVGCCSASRRAAAGWPWRHGVAVAGARGAHHAAGADRGAAVGRFRGDRRAHDAGRQHLGERVQMQVKSTAYGPISLIITIGAAALLALLFLRRLVRFLLRRRRAAAAPRRAAAAPDGAPRRPAHPEPGVIPGPEESQRPLTPDRRAAPGSAPSGAAASRSRRPPTGRPRRRRRRSRPRARRRAPRAAVPPPPRRTPVGARPPPPVGGAAGVLAAAGCRPPSTTPR